MEELKDLLKKISQRMDALRAIEERDKSQHTEYLMLYEDYLAVDRTMKLLVEEQTDEKA